MFNPFNKKKDENPVGKILSDLTTNQKMSVMNLLTTVAVCDGEQGNPDKEIQCLNRYVKDLNVRSDKTVTYLQTYGHERINEDLQSLSKNQKEFLVNAAWEMITCDGSANETEMEVVMVLFEKLGVSEEQFITTIKKTQALMNHFFGK